MEALSHNYYLDNDNGIEVVVTAHDEPHTPVLDATVTATVYKGRSLLDPVSTPGTAVQGLTGLSLALLAGAPTAGTYRVDIEETVRPKPGQYVLVVDAATPGGGNGHWEDIYQVMVRHSKH